MLGIRADSMIVLDDSIEDPGEVLVAIAISSVDTAVLIVEYKSICNSLDEGEPAISCRLWHSIRGSRSRCTILGCLVFKPNSKLGVKWNRSYFLALP